MHRYITTVAALLVATTGLTIAAAQQAEAGTMKCESSSTYWRGVKPGPDGLIRRSSPTPAPHVMYPYTAIKPVKTMAECRALLAGTK